MRFKHQALFLVLAFVLALAVVAQAATVQTNAVKVGTTIEGTGVGEVLCRSGEWFSASEVAANATIQMVPVPKGAMILDIVITHSDAAVTMNVGDGDDADRFMASVSTAAAGIVDFGEAGATATNSTNWIMPANDTVDISAAAAWPASKRVTMDVYYKMSGRIADETVTFTRD